MHLRCMCREGFARERYLNSYPNGIYNSVASVSQSDTRARACPSSYIWKAVKKEEAESAEKKGTQRNLNSFSRIKLARFLRVLRLYFVRQIEFLRSLLTANPTRLCLRHCLLLRNQFQPVQPPANIDSYAHFLLRLGK